MYLTLGLTYKACQKEVTTLESLTKDVTRLDLLQEAGPSTGGVQKSVKTGVANTLLAMLKCTAAEAAPWRRKVCQMPEQQCTLHVYSRGLCLQEFASYIHATFIFGIAALNFENSLAAELTLVLRSSSLSLWGSLA